MLHACGVFALFCFLSSYVCVTLAFVLLPLQVEDSRFKCMNVKIQYVLRAQFVCAVCSYMYMYRRACLLFLFLAVFVSFSHFGASGLVCLVAVAFLRLRRTLTTQFGCICFLLVSFIFCLCCWWSLLLLSLFLAGEWQFVVWLVLCLASTRLGRTVTPTVGIANPARGTL